LNGINGINGIDGIDGINGINGIEWNGIEWNRINRTIIIFNSVSLSSFIGILLMIIFFRIPICEVNSEA
jgi:hypothetical protein